MKPNANPAVAAKLTDVPTIIDGLGDVGYISTEQIATAIFVAWHLDKPILVEGSAGVGKTELALSMSRLLDFPLVRMQCYEGLDESKALYEWKYGKQLLYTQILKDKLSDVLGDAGTLNEAMERLHGFGDVFFSEQFLEQNGKFKTIIDLASPLKRARDDEGRYPVDSLLQVAERRAHEFWRMAVKKD